MLNTFAPLRRRKPSIVDESNHDGAEQESFSEQQRFVQTEITFTLRKNGDHRASGLGSRSFPVVRLAKGSDTSKNLVQHFEIILISCDFSDFNDFVKHLKLAISEEKLVQIILLHVIHASQLLS